MATLLNCYCFSLFLHAHTIIYYFISTGTIYCIFLLFLSLFIPHLHFCLFVKLIIA